ncbi:MAG: acyltransferase [Calditrichia bacterium]
MKRPWYFKPIYWTLNLLAGPAFANPLFHPKGLLKCFLWQKILRINGRVPWPVHFTSQVKAPEKIRRGTRNPGLAIGCYLDGRNGIIIGENTWIGPRVSLISMNHDVQNYHSYVEADPIVIGRDCWIGTGATLLAGVQIGNHVVVAAGSTVTKSIPDDDVLLAGTPARIIKHLEPYKQK